MTKVDITTFPRDLNDEQLKVFKEALYKSKGQSNNRLGGLLAVAGATPDEIARFASRVTEQNSKFLFKPKNKKTNSCERAARQALRAVPNFWETVKGRKMKAKHSEILIRLGVNPDEYFPTTKFSAKLSQSYLQRAYRASGKGYCFMPEMYNFTYSHDAGRTILAAEVLAPLADVKFANDKSLELLANNTCVVMSDILTDLSKVDDYDKYRKYDIDSLAHMDESITEKIEPLRLMIEQIRVDCSWHFRFPEMNKSIEFMCVLEGFYDVCKEMGIVGVMNSKAQGRAYSRGGSCIGIMKNVIRMGGTYRRLVKSGFTESVARETVLVEINDNIIKRANRPCLRFYPRNDYKDTLPEEREVKKETRPAAKSKTSGQGRKVMTVDEFLEYQKSLKDKGGENEKGKEE